MSANLDEQIYELFTDQEYLKEYSNIVASYQAIENNSDMKREAKEKYKNNAKQLINQLKNKKAEKAAELIEEAKKKADFTFPDQPAAKNSQEELLQEIKKSNQLSLIKEEISSTSDIKELIDIAREHEEKPLIARDVDRLVKAKFKKEGQNEAINRLNAERQPTSQTIEKSKHLVKFLTSGDKITEAVKKDNGDYEFNWRNIDKDLKTGETPKDYGMMKAEINKAIKGVE